MSKKSRLQKEKKRQDEQRRLESLEELEEREAARHKESKAARKMRRSAKRGYSNLLIVLLSIVMLGAFWYYGFYYGGMSIVGDLRGLAENIPKHTGVLFIIADIAMMIGIVLSFGKRYIAQGFFTVGGSLLFLYTGHRIVRDIQQRMEKYGTTPDIENMDRQYMGYYYPIAIVTVIGAGIMIYGIVRILRKKQREKIKRDNAPVKSIVE